MHDYQSFFRTQPSGVFATVDKGMVRTRVFQFLWADDNRLYFCTSNKKPVYTQLQADPAASFCAWNPATFEVMSVSGRAVFVDDPVGKARVLEENPGIREIYQDSTNPEFELFYLEVTEGEFFSFTAGTERFNA